MTARTYLLLGLLLHLTACHQKDNSGAVAFQREADSLYTAAVRHYDSNPDSALNIGRHLLELARKAKDSTEVTRAFTVIGYTHYIKGNYPEALDTFQLALDIDNEFNLEKNKATHTNHIGNIYKSLENYDTARQRYLTADGIAWRGREIVLARKNPDTLLLKSYDTVRSVAALNLAYIFEKKAGEHLLVRQEMRKYIDTAFTYGYLAMHLAQTLPHRKNLDIVFNNLGKIHRLQGRKDSALYYFKMAIDSSFGVLDTRGRGEANIFLAELYDDLHQYDSAIYYGRTALDEVESSSYRRGKLMSYAVLAHAFEKLNKKDSAFHYLKAKDAMYRRLFSINNVQQLQVSAIEHKNMEERRAREKAEAAKKRKEQMIRYAITLVIFFSLAFLVFKVWKKARHRWLSMVATVIVLMTFELLNEFIHSWIEGMLERSPWGIFNQAAFLWFFLIAVLLAVFLFNPAHHWLEKWFTAKLSTDKEKDEVKSH